MKLIESYWDCSVFNYAGVDIPRHYLYGFMYLTVDLDGTVKAHNELPSFLFKDQTWDTYGCRKVAKVDLEGLDPEMSMKRIR